MGHLTVECERLASLPDDYLDLVRSIDDDDEFIFKSVDMGVPLRTATDIIYQRPGMKSDIGTQKKKVIFFGQNDFFRLKKPIWPKQMTFFLGSNGTFHPGTLILMVLTGSDCLCE